MEACARIRARPRCCWKRHRMRNSGVNSGADSPARAPPLRRSGVATTALRAHPGALRGARLGTPRAFYSLRAAAATPCAAMSGRGQQQEQKGPSRCVSHACSCRALLAGARYGCALAKGAPGSATLTHVPFAPGLRSWQQRAAGKAELYASSTERTTLGAVRPHARWRRLLLGSHALLCLAAHPVAGTGLRTRRPGQLRRQRRRRQPRVSAVPEARQVDV